MLPQLTRITALCARLLFPAQPPAARRPEPLDSYYPTFLLASSSSSLLRPCSSPSRPPALLDLFRWGTHSTRLGSYIKLTKDMEGLVVVLGNVGVPEAVRNFDIP